MMADDHNDVVLVTGGTGFLASHIIKQLLLSNYNVRTTVRDLKNAEKLDALNNLVANSKHKLEIYEATLENEESWLNPIKGCDFVIHTASPIPKTPPSNPQEFAKKVEMGTKYILKACVQEGCRIRRFVYTSSIVAISGDKLEDERTYSENDWPDPKNLNAYGLSKYLSEKAAWDFVKERNDNKLGCFELTVINPGFILGPVLYDNAGESVDLVRKIMLKEFPMLFLPDVYMPTCDVRDVALAHIRALFIPEALFNRHIIVSTIESPSIQTWAMILDKEFHKKYSIPNKVIPNIFIRIYSLFDKTAAEKVPNLSKRTKFQNSRMTDILLIQPIPLEKTLIDTAYSLIEREIIPKR